MCIQTKPKGCNKPHISFDLLAVITYNESVALHDFYDGIRESHSIYIISLFFGFLKYRYYCKIVQLTRGVPLKYIYADPLYSPGTCDSTIWVPVSLNDG
jgi:hypothetical protein